MESSSYRLLAERLDSLPNGFPPTEDGTELRLLAKLYTPEEAQLAAQLRLARETPAQIAARLGGDAQELGARLKAMARRGLIEAGRAEGGVGYALMPFVVGIYEMQWATIDAELAQLFEDYYLKAFGRALTWNPPVHRVIPVNESVQAGIEIHPFESAADLVNQASAWGVLDCICRKQSALVGRPCPHPVDVCMAFAKTPGAFDASPNIRALTRDEALATLRRAAEAGLVHSVSNSQRGVWYVCNCCTCSCAILRGIAALGIANVIARSAFVNQVDEAACNGCALCVEACQFEALAVGDGVAHVNATRCVGCGVCAIRCADGALALVRRPEAEVLPVPASYGDWRAARAAARGIELEPM